MHILVLINRSSGELEWIIPVLVSLSSDRNKISILFLRHKEHSYYKKSKHLQNIVTRFNIETLILEESLSIPVFIKKSFEKIIYLTGLNALLSKKFLKVKLLANGLVSNIDCLLIDNSFYKDLEKGNGSGFHHSLFDTIDAKKIIIFPHAPVLDFQNKKISDKLILKKNEKRNNFYWKNYFNKAQNTLQITDNEDNSQHYFSNRGLFTVCVKNPRYQLNFDAVISEPSSRSPNNSEQNVLILSKLQGQLFKKNQSINPLKLIKDIIKALEKNNISWKIKLHPRDDLAALETLIKKISCKKTDDIFFNGALDSESNCFAYCVSVPTSAVLDSVFFGIPTIEYFPSMESNVKNSYDSPYQARNIVIGCNNTMQLEELIQSFKNYTILNETSLKQNTNLRSCFSSGHDAVDTINHFCNLST